MGMACSKREGEERCMVHIKFRWGNLSEGDHLQDLGIDGNILKWSLKSGLNEGGGGMDWVDLAQDSHRWWALVNTVMNPHVH